MSFFQLLRNFVESLFYGNSPEGKRRRDVKKIEVEIREINPPIYKNGLILPAFASEMYILYQQLEPLEKILTATILDTDLRVATKFTDFLISSGFREPEHSIYNFLFSDERKNAFIQATDRKAETEEQKKKFDLLIKALSASDFQSIDVVIGNVKKLADLFSFGFTEFFRHFDHDFVKDNPAYAPCFHSVTAIELVNLLMDFYFVIDGLEINMGVARAVVILAGQISGGAISPDEQDDLMASIKKTASLIKKNLCPDVIRMVLRIIKQDPLFKPESGKPEKNILPNFCERLKIQYAADTKRIELDVQDQKLETGIKDLFGSISLCVVEGYDAETNHFLQTTTPYSFFWITPLQVLKTFILSFFGAPIRELLDTILIEGFFSNQNFQTNFSTSVYHCEDITNIIADFENSFKTGKVNDISLLKGYIQDSRNGNDFDRKIKEMIERINLTAKKTVQTETQEFFNLSVRIKELIDDSKKPGPEYVNNIRGIITSAKNRENFEYLENHYSVWLKFLELMKNYVIIGST